MTRLETLWVAVGFLGQGVFTARFLVQWLASEKKRESYVPVAFWWLSLIGGLITLSYAIHRADPVFTVGQSMGLFIYSRNLMLVAKAKQRAAKRQGLARVSAASASTIPKPHHLEARSHSRTASEAA